MLTAAWLNAYKKTQSTCSRHGLVPRLPSLTQQQHRYINPTFTEHVGKLINARYSGKPLSELSLRCTVVHDLIYNDIYDTTSGIDCFLTIGWLSYKNRPLFQHAMHEVDEWLNLGIRDVNGIKMHAWITFPSGEILDATIGTVLALSGDSDFEIGDISWIPSETEAPFEYHPTLIGYSALKQLGLAT